MDQLVITRENWTGLNVKKRNGYNAYEWLGYNILKPTGYKMRKQFHYNTCTGYIFNHVLLALLASL